MKILRLKNNDFGAARSRIKETRARLRGGLPVPTPGHLYTNFPFPKGITPFAIYMQRNTFSMQKFKFSTQNRTYILYVHQYISVCSITESSFLTDTPCQCLLGLKGLIM